LPDAKPLLTARQIAWARDANSFISTEQEQVSRAPSWKKKSQNVRPVPVVTAEMRDHSDGTGGYLNFL
jgi:hypothetical protein